MRSAPQLELADARRVAAAARSKAEAEAWTVVIAIVDEGGHLMFLERLDGTQKGSSVVAQEKARTALLFKRPTQALEAAIAAGKLQMLDLPGATPIEGGLPLLVEGHVVGAIGVSGVLSGQDGQVAAAGAAVL
ncbi:MAG: heme-binding protein [Burkholderiales bacterium]|nr:heme-binding protein [Burkholderiales bacterium]